jgi:lambda repressor-like predicted transcriptional regulator
MMKKIPLSWLLRHAELEDEGAALAGTGDLADFEVRVARAEHTTAQPTPAHAVALVVKAACAQEGLDRKQLRDRAGLSEDDVANVLEATAPPSLRVVAGLSKALHLSRGKLALIAGLGSATDAQNDDVMVRYATLSKGMSTLDDGGRELVAEFIKFMSEE